MEWPGNQQTFSNVFYKAVWNLIHFHKFFVLILLQNVNCFFWHLKQFQTLLRVWSTLIHQPWAYSEISMFSTLHRPDALSQLSKNIQKNWNQNHPRASDVCLQMPSNSKNESQDSFQNTSSAVWNITMVFLFFHKNLNLSNIRYDYGSFYFLEISKQISYFS